MSEKKKRGGGDERQRRMQGWMSPPSLQEFWALPGEEGAERRENLVVMLSTCPSRPYQLTAGEHLTLHPLGSTHSVLKLGERA